MPQEWVRSGSNLAERSREFQQFVKFSGAGSLTTL